MKTELASEEKVTFFDSRGGWNRCKFDANFFQKWSNEMAYALGFLYADGGIVDATVSSRAQYVNFWSKDREIIKKIRSVLKAEHPIHSRLPHWILSRNGKQYKVSEVFHLRIGSRKMFADLIKIGLTPNKSKTMRFPSVPAKCLSHFVRGYFDGDGSIFMYRRKGSKQKLIFKKALTVFSSGSRTFLEELADVLTDKIKVRRSKIYNGNGCFQDRYSTGDTVVIFKFMYADAMGLFLKRKFDIFGRFFNERTKWLDNEVAKILNENRKYLAR